MHDNSTESVGLLKALYLQPMPCFTQIFAWYPLDCSITLRCDEISQLVKIEAHRFHVVAYFMASTSHLTLHIPSIKVCFPTSSGTIGVGDNYTLHWCFIMKHPSYRNKTTSSHLTLPVGSKVISNQSRGGSTVLPLRITWGINMTILGMGVMYRPSSSVPCIPIAIHDVSLLLLTRYPLHYILS